MTGHRDSPQQDLPACVTEYIETLVSGLERSPQTALEVRRELISHFQDALGHLPESSRSEYAQVLIAQFGTAAVLATLIRRAKKRRRREETMNISGIFGICLFILVMWAALQRPHATYALVDPAALALCLGLSAALSAMSMGARTLVHAMGALRIFVVRCSPGEVSLSDAASLREMIRHVYAASGIMFLMGVITLLRSGGSSYDYGLSAALLYALYAALTAEGVLRPAARRIERLAAGIPAEDAEGEAAADPSMSAAE